jgi:hypothetical protein
MSEQPEVIIKFKVPDPEPEMYPVSCIREQGRPVLIVRATNALAINSPRAKQIASKSQAHVPGYQNNGIEPLGGAYCVDAESGEFLQNPPQVKEGSTLPATLRYERKFRLNPSL